MRTPSKKQQAEQEREEARTRLREVFPPGSTVYTILRHVSRSGMQRSISAIAAHTGERPLDASWLVARATSFRFDRERDGLKVGGCGMDMGFHLVYSLSYVLYRDGFGCVGPGCPSNDHSNGDRDYTPHGPTDAEGNPEDRDPGPGEAKDGLRRHWHNDGGYALRQRWL